MYSLGALSSTIVTIQLAQLDVCIDVSVSLGILRDHMVNSSLIVRSILDFLDFNILQHIVGNSLFPYGFETIFVKLQQLKSSITLYNCFVAITFLDLNCR